MRARPLSRVLLSQQHSMFATKSVGSSLVPTGDPHWIYFVDVNGTVIATDSERNKDTRTSIIHMLAEWEGVWDADVTTTPMSYYDYVDTYLIDTDNADVRRAQRDAYFAEFLTFLEERNHPLFDRAVETIQRAELILEDNDGHVFPSFIKMIEELEARKFKYTIIFRSYGTDTDFVLDEITRKTGISFNQHLSFKEDGLLTEDQRLVQAPEEMLQVVKPGQHGKWNDDYVYWNSNNRKHDFAKPFPIDVDDVLQTVPVFIDDNARDAQIIKVRDVQNPDAAQQQRQDELFEQGRIVHLETLDAILNPNHFVKIVDKMVAQREKDLANLQQLDQANESSYRNHI